MPKGKRSKKPPPAFIKSKTHQSYTMPKVTRSKPPPEGWELIEPTLKELEQKMREGI